MLSIGSNCSSPLPIPHSCPSLPKKSFPVIYLYPSLFRVLAEAALALVDEAGGEQEVTLSHTGDGRARSRGPSTSQVPGLRHHLLLSSSFPCMFSFPSSFLAFSFFLWEKRSPSASKEINPIYYLSLSKCASLARDAGGIRNSPSQKSKTLGGKRTGWHLGRETQGLRPAQREIWLLNLFLKCKRSC